MVNILRKLGQPAAVIALVFAVIFGTFGSLKADAAEVYEGTTQVMGDEYGLGIYVKPQGSSDYGEVAYCFNFDRHFPGYGGQKTLYDKEKGTPDLFVKMADTPRLDKNLSGDAQKEDFYKKVLTILYNGYPLNKTGLMKKYNVTPQRMRMMTQAAVWYMTDSMELEDMPLEPDPNEKSAFDELLAMMTTTKLPAEFGLNLFTAQDGSFQNLLSSGIYFGDNPDTPITPEQPEETKVTVNFSKVETGKDVELSGASLKVVKGETEDGEAVEQWTSGTSVKEITLNPGTYTMVEVTAPKGYDKASPITFKVTEDGTLQIKDGNSWKTATSCVIQMEDNKKEAEKTSVSVTKKWSDGGDQDGVRPNTVSVNLYANGKKSDQSVILSDGNNWKSEFTNLDKYDDNDTEIKYTVQEVKVDGYTSEVSGDAKDGFTVKNTHKPATTSVEGTKTWKDSNDNDKKRPDSITVRLYKDGTEIDSKKVTKEDNWSWKFDNLDKYQDGGKTVLYTVTEDAVEGYTSQVDGYNVENKYEPKKVSVSVTKRWKDHDDRKGERPDEVKFTLYVDGKATDKTLTLTEEDKWAGAFTDLPKYENGKEIQYTVKENKVDGYSAVVSGDMTKGFVATNSYNDGNGSGTGSESNSNGGNGSTINTGDNSMMKLYVGLALAALAGIGTVVGIRRKTGLN